MDYSSPPCPARHKWPVAVAVACAAAAFAVPLRAFASCYCCRRRRPHLGTGHAFDVSPDASQQCALVMWAIQVCTWLVTVILEDGEEKIKFVKS